MRTALMLSGHLRTYQQCYQAVLDKIVKPTQADVFISTWSLLGFSDLRKWSVKKLEDTVDETAVRTAYGDALKQLRIESYDDLAGQFDTIDKVNPHSGKPNRHYRTYKNPFTTSKLKRMRSMWYKVWDADTLRREYEQQQGFTYDRLIRARPDSLFYCGVPDFDLTKNVVYFPRSYIAFGWNDQFAVGSNATMTTYCNLYNCLDLYMSEDYRLTTWVEGLVKHHCDRNGIGKVIGQVRYLLVRPKRH